MKSKKNTNLLNFLIAEKFLILLQEPNGYINASFIAVSDESDLSLY